MGDTVPRRKGSGCVRREGMARVVRVFKCDFVCLRRCAGFPRFKACAHAASRRRCCACSRWHQKAFKAWLSWCCHPNTTILCPRAIEKVSITAARSRESSREGEIRVSKCERTNIVLRQRSKAPAFLSWSLIRLMAQSKAVTWPN